MFSSSIHPWMDGHLGGFYILASVAINRVQTSLQNRLTIFLGKHPEGNAGPHRNPMWFP
jgi:hypothetical protein